MLKLNLTFSKFTLQFLKFIGIFSKICLLASLISASSHASLNCNSQLEAMSIISMAEADVVTAAAAAGTVADDVVTTAARDGPATGAMSSLTDLTTAFPCTAEYKISLCNLFVDEGARSMYL